MIWMRLPTTGPIVWMTMDMWDGSSSLPIPANVHVGDVIVARLADGRTRGQVATIAEVATGTVEPHSLYSIGRWCEETARVRDGEIVPCRACGGPQGADSCAYDICARCGTWLCTCGHDYAAHWLGSKDGCQACSCVAFFPRLRDEMEVQP